MSSTPTDVRLSVYASLVVRQVLDTFYVRGKAAQTLSRSRSEDLDLDLLYCSDIPNHNGHIGNGETRLDCTIVAASSSVSTRRCGGVDVPGFVVPD